VHSIRADRPLDPTVLAALGAVHNVAAPQQWPLFVIGATARDILLSHVFGISTGRATLDVDFAIALQDWAQFETVRQRLLATEGFSASSDGGHRLYYRATGNGFATPIDLIPFGGVEGPPATIKWPPDMAVMLNVAGYADAWQAAVEVEVSPNLRVRVASLAGLAVLKLIAWRARGLEHAKDAEDLQFLLRHYAHAGNLHRLYEAEINLLEAADYNLDLAGMALLGKDVAAVAGAEAYAQCIAILDNPTLRDRLALHMASSQPGAQDAMASAEHHLQWFRRGLDLRAITSPSV